MNVIESIRQRENEFADQSAVIDGEELRVYCRERLAGYKCPKRITVVNESLPKNRSGKILKTAIIEMLLAATKEQL